MVSSADKCKLSNDRTCQPPWQEKNINYQSYAEIKVARSKSPKSNRNTRNELFLICSHFDGKPEQGEAYGRQFSRVLIMFINRHHHRASFQPKCTLLKINAVENHEGV